MQLALIIIAAEALLELLLYLPTFWKARRAVSLLMLGLTGAATIYLVLRWPSWSAFIVAYFGLYRCVNLFRIYKSRIQSDYLYSAGLRTSVWLIGCQASIVLIAKLSELGKLQFRLWLWLLAIAQLLLAITLWLTARRNTTALSHDPPGRPPFADLPTLTVAIPARNETTELEKCLNSLIASTYPKLEVIVLDDNSQDKRTPEIIRGFAQHGVRFIPGGTPPGQWLAKNFAYKQLAEAANGDLLLFCGVDVVFETDSLTSLVSFMSDGRKNMLCVLPRNFLDSGQGRALGLLLQPLRYGWELALPRRLLRRPPVLSTCWLIRRQALSDAGGFEAVSQKIIPESYFARAAATSEAGYSFIASGHGASVTSHKIFAEQRATTIRTRYPQLHKRLELVASLSLIEFLGFLWPWVALLVALASHYWLLGLASLAGLLITLWLNISLVKLTYKQIPLACLWMSPFAACLDVGLLNYSMWRYEFRHVLWKGRDVSGPVMRF